jgi:hypothetical protein
MRNRGQSPPLLPFLLAALLALAVAPARAENIDPDGDGHQYAWGENVGWLNAEPSEDGGNGVQVADFTLTGWMWGENIGWVSLTCDNTGTCGSTQYGVVNDGSGKLSGLAWSENAGWIDFAPTTCLPDPTCGVKIDPTTGYFSGRAWGENIGWVSFSSGAPELWTARSSWCQGTSAAPGPVPGLTLAKAAPEFVLSWAAPQGASWFDVVEGTLSRLRASRGNFALATDACVANRLSSTSIAAPGSVPPPGDGFWFLVRAANCRGRATYDDGTPSQKPGRDAGIAASQHACP